MFVSVIFRYLSYVAAMRVESLFCILYNIGIYGASKDDLTRPHSPYYWLFKGDVCCLVRSLTAFRGWSVVWILTIPLPTVRLPHFFVFMF